MRKSLTLCPTLPVIASLWLILLPAPLRAVTPCADVNQDGAVDLSDPVVILNWLFLGGPRPACVDSLVDCGNVNADGSVDVSDAVRLLGWLFRGGPDPVCQSVRIKGFTSLGVNSHGFAEYQHEQTDIVFVLLPGGTFLMGAQGHDLGAPNYDQQVVDNEGPVHEVSLSPFLIAKYEVTQAQWRRVMEENPSCFQPDGRCFERLAPELLPNERWLSLPVESVSWDEIQSFEESTGLTLPTEAQWECACRAGTGGPVSGGGVLDEVGWYAENSDHTTHVVGSKQPNGFGLHDMYGNVAEWCEDVFNHRFYRTADAMGPDPLATSGSPDRVIRGGSFAGTAAECRSADRYRFLPSSRSVLIGFRPAGLLP